MRTFEKNAMKFDRISVDPKIMMGKPCIKGTRITVELILEKLAGGYTYEDLLEAYPRLTIEDIKEVLKYAHAVLTHEKIIEATVA